ncbi:MAG: hypothetical protein M3X11_13825 [Acidobacteriota bacterium]|nr:hypothetical protein [Acidobacteriota bacterium]
MVRKMILFTVSILILSTAALTAFAQNKKAEKKVDQVAEKIAPSNDLVKITIQSVTKNDPGAKQNADGKSRNVPVSFTWLCGSQGNAKLAELIAELVTQNTDGSQTRVSKKMVDWRANTPINSQIDLPMPEGVFASSFTLTLVGKFKRGLIDELVDVRAVKSGSFPVAPGSSSQRK